MSDTKQNPQEVPPPEGGGQQTTDPTFAKQTESAPAEKKPESKSDLNKKS